ncbi:MAG: DUF3185 family protein [Planctomycetes bacterium]|jgi:uncharacterized membrane protein|nr:DUF3185 family protein [Planctomycetota bacterium]
MKMPIALAILVVGIILLLFGLNSSQSILDSFSRIFSGQFSDRTMWFIVGGSVCVVVGLYGTYYNRRV